MISLLGILIGVYLLFILACFKAFSEEFLPEIYQYRYLECYSKMIFYIYTFSLIFSCIWLYFVIFRKKIYLENMLSKNQLKEIRIFKLKNKLKSL